MQRKGEGYRNNQNCSCYKKGFAMPQAYGKAVKKLERTFSKSPSKKVKTVIGLVKLVQSSKSDFNRNRKKYEGLSHEAKSQVVDFYYQTDVMFTAPGLKDEITVWTEKGKEKMRKYCLTMYLHEIYGMFKTLYPDSEIGFTMFTKFRPNNVLLLKNQSKDQCKLYLPENFPLKLEVLRITFDATLWSEVLCCSENYNFEY